MPVCFCGSFFQLWQAIPSPAAKCFAHLKRRNAYLRLRYTVGGDKEGSLWINRKKSDGVVEKYPEISYTKK